VDKEDLPIAALPGLNFQFFLLKKQKKKKPHTRLQRSPGIQQIGKVSLCCRKGRKTTEENRGIINATCRKRMDLIHPAFVSCKAAGD